MAEAQEKTLAHSRSCDQNLQRGWGFIQNGSYGEKSEKIWVRDMAKVKINKMAEKAEVQFKKKEGKKTSFACKSFRNTAKCYRLVLFLLFSVSFCYFKVRSNGFERTRLRNSVPLVDSMLLK